MNSIYSPQQNNFPDTLIDQSIHVPSGLGDAWWTFQRLVPYLGPNLDVTIATTTPSPEGKRTEPWLKEAFPFIRSVETKVVPPHIYEEILKSTELKDIRSHPRKYYSVNRPLEKGIKLNDIDDLKVDWDLPINISPFKLPFPTYQVAFVHLLGSWPATKWAELLNSTGLPTILLGQTWDVTVLKALAKHLDVEHHMMISESPTRVLFALHEAKLFIGFQSGLNIMCSRLGTPDVMVYSDSLKRMFFTWNDPRHYDIHHPFTFFSDFNEIKEAATKYKV